MTEYQLTPESVLLEAHLIASHRDLELLLEAVGIVVPKWDLEAALALVKQGDILEAERQRAEWDATVREAVARKKAELSEPMDE